MSFSGGRESLDLDCASEIGARLSHGGQLHRLNTVCTGNVHKQVV